MTFKVREKRFLSRPRRLVVKRSLYDTFSDDLESEIEIMKKVNGSAHVARVIASSRDSRPELRPGFFGRLIFWFSRRQRNFLVGLPGSTLILEYLEHGILNDVIFKIRDRNLEEDAEEDAEENAEKNAEEDGGRPLPNRLLWRWFLCLARACVALKFPAGQPVDTIPKLEEIPADQSNPGNIYHGDMHGGNILIGSTGDFPEHELVPPLKLIDFGQAGVYDSYDSYDTEGDERNIYDIGTQIIHLIKGSTIVGWGNAVHKGIPTLATSILPDNDNDPHPHLDSDLRDLVASCLAVDPLHRPTVSEILELCKSAVERKTPASYGANWRMETDSEVQRTLQELVYNV
ncbi:hypothetical protein F4825DRAFT_471095 [Nemania diffusa]|nr:hypothetical protein F4825DRAFT_471095 [Nemania diffusa]